MNYRSHFSELSECCLFSAVTASEHFVAIFVARNFQTGVKHIYVIDPSRGPRYFVLYSKIPCGIRIYRTVFEYTARYLKIPEYRGMFFGAAVTVLELRYTTGILTSCGTPIR